MLVSTAALQAHLGDPGWIAFDCRHDLFDLGRGAKAYAAGHIPGAVFAPVDDALSGVKSGTNGRHPLPTPEAFAEFLARAGVTAGTQLVAYDDAAGLYAARLWWMARWIGHERVAVLDGGYTKWLAEKRPVTTELPPVRARGQVAVKLGAMGVVGTDDVQRGIASGRCLVLDARTPDRFRGEAEPIDRVAGHIPTAKNRPYKANLNADLSMRPAAELRAEYEQLLGGVSPAAVLHQCGSGVTACSNLLAMEHAGLAGSKLYVGSWSEWISDPARPIATGN